MKQHRLARVAEVVREVASETILFELQDPRIKGVTVTRTEVSGDLQHAKVYVSLMGTAAEQKLCMYMDSGFVARMMVPYAKVLERQNGKVKVTFTVQFRKRVDDLRRQLSRVTFVGWTDAKNLLDKEIL